MKAQLIITHPGNAHFYDVAAISRILYLMIPLGISNILLHWSLDRLTDSGGSSKN